MQKEYYVVKDRPAHEGYVAHIPEKSWWSTTNPDGVTEQSLGGCVTGPFFKHEAEKRLAEYLECDSVEEGTYCYAHNPYPKK